jgi:hypothetical protein
MAEAFAAIGIAASIAKLTEYGVTLIAEAQEFYESASVAREENIELEEVIRYIKNLSEDISAASPLASSAGPLSSNERALIKLAKDSKSLCNQLIEILQDLKVGDEARFRKLACLRQAMRSARKKKDIEKLEARLRKIQDEATKRMVYILKYIVRTLYLLVLSYELGMAMLALSRRLNVVAKRTNGTRHLG